MFNGYTRPFDTRFHNKVEMFNEICIWACSYFLMFYTDFTGGPEFQLMLGWPHVGVIGLCVLVNMTVLISCAVSDAIS